MTDPASVLARIDSTIEAWEVGPDVARWYSDEPPEDPAVAAIAAAMQAIGRVFIEAWPGIMAAVTAAFQQSVENVTATGLAFQKLGFPVRIRNGARSCLHRPLYEACDFCYPQPFPVARDYRRRTRHRNRRRR